MKDEITIACCHTVLFVTHAPGPCDTPPSAQLDAELCRDLHVLLIYQSNMIHIGTTRNHHGLLRQSAFCDTPPWAI